MGFNLPNWRALAAILVVVLACSPAQAASPQIDHFVVLMLENRYATHANYTQCRIFVVLATGRPKLTEINTSRAFDHMLGYLKQNNSEIRGLTGNEFNYLRPFDPSSPKIFVNPNGHYVVESPAHSIPGTAMQTYGDINNTAQDPAPMSGFVRNEQHVFKKVVPGSIVMSSFSPITAPVLNTLASEFAVFDAFFSSVPGPTEVNRLFAQSGSSDGLGFNDLTRLIPGVPQKTFFNQMEEQDVSWAVYMAEVASTWFFKSMRQVKYYNNYRDMWTFMSDVQAGNLPRFSWMEPTYFSVPEHPANDQHPAHSVREGELLVKQVYEALRASPKWNNTAFIIFYDEHGGFYDHYPPPAKNIPNPDGLNSTKPVFSFDRLGVRVPFVVCSPWIKKGTVVHEPPAAQRPTPSSQYDHTSLMATVRKMVGMTGHLTKRDQWAATFEHIFNLDQPRQDCPTTLPTPPKAFFTKNLATEHTQPIHDLQVSLLAAAAAFHDEFDILEAGPRALFQTEGKAGMWARKRFKAMQDSTKMSEEL